jgi:hypothetical protein
MNGVQKRYYYYFQLNNTFITILGALFCTHCSEFVGKRKAIYNINTRSTLKTFRTRISAVTMHLFIAERKAHQITHESIVIRLFSSSLSLSVGAHTPVAACSSGLVQRSPRIASLSINCCGVA